MENEVLKCIKERRSIRKFEKRPVEDEKIAALLEAAVWAPSGSNSQLWSFVAIANEQKLEGLNEAVKKGFETWSPDDDYPAKWHAKENARKESFNFYYHAPVLIVATNERGYTNALADCCLGLENIFLAAHSMGLGSCFINQLKWLDGEEGVRAYLSALGLPKERLICGAAAVGYAAISPKAPERKQGRTAIVR